MILCIIMNAYVVWAGLCVPVHIDYMLIVIISLIMERYQSKYTCMAYVVPCIYFLDQLLILLQIKEQSFQLAYVQLISMIGILHFFEGVLAFFFGSIRQQVLVTYREDKIAGGYHTYGRWMIPLLFFTIKGYYVPLLAGIVYNNETFTHSAGSKAEKMGGAITIFGAIVLVLSQISKKGQLSLTLLILIVPILHEVLFIWDWLLEEQEVIYTFPTRGIRLMGFAKAINIPSPFEGGDIILSINRHPIKSEEDYMEAVKAKFLLMHIERISGEKRYILMESKAFTGLQPVFLPPE